MVVQRLWVKIMPAASKVFGALTDSMMNALKRLNEGMKAGDDVVSTQELIDAPFGEPLKITGTSSDGTVAQVYSPRLGTEMNVFLSDLAPVTGDMNVDETIQRLLRDEDRNPGALADLLGEFNVSRSLAEKRSE